MDIINIFISLCFLGVSFFFFIFVLLRLYFTYKRRSHRNNKKLSVGFFHPYCNDGGGGERVLWKLISALQKQDTTNQIKIVVYSGDQRVDKKQILQTAAHRFNITFDKEIEFVFLKTRHWVEKSKYPRFTILGQSLGSIILGIEALIQFTPDVFLDTMGYAFTYPFANLFAGCYVGCYMHYPTISVDMLHKVSNRSSSFNNDQEISKSLLKTYLKLIYYRVFAMLYRRVGRFSSLVMVNSTWTRSHVLDIIGPKNCYLVYPPVPTSTLSDLALTPRSRLITSIGQFRPEKNHPLQISSFEALRSEDRFRDVKLVMIGGVRNSNKEDLELVDNLRQMIKSRGLEDSVSLLVNLSIADLTDYLSRAEIGLHTMTDEHFGIGVVELMAAGVIPVAHDSGGPKLDIVLDHEGQKTGFLASTPSSYASCMSWILDHPSESLAIRENARRYVIQKFSDERFDEHVIECLSLLLPLQTYLRKKKD